MQRDEDRRHESLGDLASTPLQVQLLALPPHQGRNHPGSLHLSTSASTQESGFFSKEYFIKLHTQYGKVKLSLKGHNEAKITIEGVVKRKAWLVPYVEKKQENTMYTGIFNKIREENQVIKAQSQTVGASF